MKVLASLPDRSAVDSEIIALDKGGKPTFSALQISSHAPNRLLRFRRGGTGRPGTTGNVSTAFPFNACYRYSQACCATGIRAPSLRVMCSIPSPCPSAGCPAGAKHWRRFDTLSKKTSAFIACIDSIHWNAACLETIRRWSHLEALGETPKDLEGSDACPR